MKRKEFKKKTRVWVPEMCVCMKIATVNLKSLELLSLESQASIAA